jgi:hypothetical protein
MGRSDIRERSRGGRHKGRLAAKLLYIDLPGGPLAISGSQGTEGKANTAGVVIGIVSFGLLGLLMKGGNAHFKAGDILTGYNGVYQPASPSDGDAVTTIDVSAGAGMSPAPSRSDRLGAGSAALSKFAIRALASDGLRWRLRAFCEAPLGVLARRSHRRRPDEQR